MNSFVFIEYGKCKKILLVFGTQRRIFLNTVQMKTFTVCTLVSAQFRSRFQYGFSVKWSVCLGTSVAEFVPISLKTTAVVFCTIDVHKVVHSLRTPANGCWLQRMTAIHGVDSNFTADFAHPVRFSRVSRDSSSEVRPAQGSTR